MPFSLSLFRFFPLFPFFSKGVLVFRYVGSVIIRFAYIVLGFGLLYLKKWGRIGFIGMAVYHLLTFFLRHPYKPFFYAVVLAEHNLLGYVYPPGTCFENGYPIFPATAYFQQLSNVLLPLILQLSLILFEIFINVFIIWFLFKREIKKEFVASGDLNEFRI